MAVLYICQSLVENCLVMQYVGKPEWDTKQKTLEDGFVFLTMDVKAYQERNISVLNKKSSNWHWCQNVQYIT